MTREAFAAASFLDGRLLTPQTQVAWRPWTDVEAAVAEAGLDERCGLIFHIGHVGSTLMSRLLEASPALLALREPQTLRTLAQVQAGLADPESLWSADSFERRLTVFLRLWSRAFAPGQTAVVKATSFCCGMAADLLARPSQPRAIFMFTTPEVYLATLLGGANKPHRHPQHGLGAAAAAARADRRSGVAAERHVLRRNGGDELDLRNDPPLAAAAGAHGGQVLWIDFERFLARPQSGLAAAFAHLGAEVAGGEIAGIVAGPEMGRYSKAPEHAYDAARRARVLAQARETGRQEIRAGLDWLEDAAARFAPIAAAVDLSARR